MGAGNLIIDEMKIDDFGQWLPLWNANNQGHSDEEVTAETWSRLINPDYPVHGLAARRNGELAGFLHYILHPVTGHIQHVCYMQDLYVDPKYRRQGIGKALVEHLAKLGKEKKWARIYWLAENDNIEAQNLYKNLGIRLNFSLHVMPL